MPTISTFDLPQLMDEATDFRFGKIQIADNVLISEIYEGKTIDVDEITEILEYGKSRFKDNSFGYVSRRINSYSVNPLVYINTMQKYNVKAVAIITTTKNGLINAKIEKLFFQGPYEIFEKEPEAIQWINENLN